MRSSSLFLSSSNLASFVLGGSVSAGVDGVGGFASGWVWLIVGLG